MKKIILSLVLFIGLMASLSAQSPAGFNYQAVVRNAMNQPIANQAVSFRINILDGGANGNPVYSETHLVNSTDLGVVNMIVGQGTVQNGSFFAIDWANNSYWMEVEMDENGGANFQVLGASQLVSVPYALHAETVTNSDDADADPSNELQNLSKSGNQITLSQGGGTVDVNDADADPNNEIQTIVKIGNQVMLTQNGGMFIDEVNDSDADSMNELQTLSFDPNNNLLTISNGNSIAIPTGGTDADADPTNELQTITKNGNTVTLSDGGGSFVDEVNDADANANNELQTIVKNGNTVTLSQGGGSFTDEVNDADANPANEIQSLSFNTNTNELSISSGNTVQIPMISNDADADPTNEIQTITKNGSTVTLSNNGGSFTDEVNDADSNPSNEIQLLSKNGSTVSLSNGGGSFTDEVNDADSNPTNEIQVLSKNGNTVSLSNGGGSFTDEVNDADNDPLNELQNLFLNGTMLELTGSAPVDLAPILPPGGTDDQILELNNNTLSIEDGNSVDLSPFVTPWVPVFAGIRYDQGAVQIKDAMDPSNPGTTLNAGLISSSDTSTEAYYLSPDMLKFQQTSSSENVADMTRFGFDVYKPGVASERGSLQKDRLQIYKDDLRSTNSYKDLVIEDTQLGNKVQIDKDSIHLHSPGVGLLLPTDGKVYPWGARFDFGGIETASYMTYGAEIVGLEEINNIGPGGFAVNDIINPNNAFERFSFIRDSLNMRNGEKWKTVWLGNEPIRNSGGLKLWSGGNDRLIAHLGDTDTDTLFGVAPAAGSLNLYDSGANAMRASLNAGFGSGTLGLYSEDSSYVFAGLGQITTGKEIKLGNLSFIEARFEAGMNANDKTGYSLIYDDQFKIKAGMEVNGAGAGCVFSDGCFLIREEGTDGTSLLSYEELGLYDSNGTPAVSLQRDLLSSSTGYVTTSGDNGNLNVYAGPNSVDNTLDHGMVSVLDHNGIERASMRADGFGFGQYRTNGALGVFNDDYTMEYTGMNGGGFNVNDDSGAWVSHLGIDLFSQDGILNLWDSSDGNLNFFAGQDQGPGACNGCGYAAIYDQNSVAQAGFYIDQNGFGNVFADLKPFRMDHPERSDKEIWYVALEGPEAAAYVRGTAELVNGEAFVPFPDHFKHVANPETMTTIVTPLSINTYGLAVVEKTREGIRVKELMGGTGSFEFDWEVKCVRQGHENFEVIRDKTNYPVERKQQPKHRNR